MVRVLYAEDDDELREMIVLWIAKAFPGIEIVATSDYHQAAAALERQGPFDFVVSDFHYPGINDNGVPNKKGSGGLDLLAHMQEKYAQTPFIFFSATRKYDIERALGERGLKLPAEHMFDKLADDPGDAIRFAISKFCPRSPAAAMAPSGSPAAKND